MKLLHHSHSTNGVSPLSLMGKLICICALIAAVPGAAADDIQRRIDEASARGGGVVKVRAGDYEVRQLLMRSNVTLELARGARIVGSTNIAHYASGAHAVVAGICVTNAAITGEGEIDGRGWAAPRRNNSKGRWMDVFFYRSRNVRVEGVTLKDAAFWTCYFKECDGVEARRVKIRSLVNFNNDGFDIESRNVLVEDCDVVSQDDGICFKSDNPDFAVENCTVRRCRVSSNCNFIKFGTSSRGAYRDIVVEDCHVECTASFPLTDWRVAGALSTARVPGVEMRDTGISAIALEVVDGGVMENVTVRNIKIGRGVQTPVFVRMGRRRSAAGGRASTMRNILIENVEGEAASLVASSITGVPGLRPRDITLRNVRLRMPGGGTAGEVCRKVPEMERAYPENRMFKMQMLPAYGFYVRHADGVRFENVELSYAGDEERPAITLDDAAGAEMAGCRLKPPSGPHPAILRRSCSTNGVSPQQHGFKTGTAAMLPAENEIVFAAGVDKGGWKLRKTADGLGYDLARAGFTIMIR